MHDTEKITEEEIELILFALNFSKEKLQQVYTKDWLDARIGDITSKLQQTLNNSEVIDLNENGYTSLPDNVKLEETIS